MFFVQGKLNPFMLNGLFFLNSLDKSISSGKGVLLVSVITMFYRNSYTECLDPDQAPYYVVSDLGLSCLPMSIFGDIRHKWVK